MKRIEQNKNDPLVSPWGNLVVTAATNSLVFVETVLKRKKKKDNFHSIMRKIDLKKILQEGLEVLHF